MSKGWEEERTGQQLWPLGPDPSAWPNPTWKELAAAADRPGSGPRSSEDGGWGGRKEGRARKTDDPEER